MYHAQSHHLLLHNIRLQRVSTDFACSFAKGFLITKTSRRPQSWRDLAQIFIGKYEGLKRPWLKAPARPQALYIHPKFRRICI